MPTSQQRQRWLALLLLAASLVLSEAAQRQAWLARIETAWYDLWHRVNGVRQPPHQVAVVSIDQRALTTFADDPLVFWTPHIARASEVLQQAGATVVGLDLLFAISPESWLEKLQLAGSDISRRYDAAFRAQINGGRLIQAGSRIPAADGGNDYYLLPDREYLLSVPDFDFAGHIGLADLENDADGTIRNFRLAPVLHLTDELQQQSLPRYSFAALLAARAQGKAVEQLQPARLAGPLLPITFAGPPGTIPRLSITRLLAPGALQDPAVQALRDKVVIIGADYPGMQDLHFTPYSGGFSGSSGRLMSGPEIQANIVATLLNQRFNQPLPATLRLAWFSALLAGALWLCLRLTPIRAGLAVSALALAAVLLAWLGFRLFYLLPLAPLHLGLILIMTGSVGLRFSSEARERQRITQLFGRYVSDRVVQRLLESGQPPQLGGEALQVTVLFSDIRNFTTLSEQLNAEEVVELLNEYFRRACEPILANDGTIDKFIGDAVMTHFGWPLHNPDHADQALRAAIAMQQVAHEFNTWLAQRFGKRAPPAFAIGVGIHSGKVVLGNIGSPRHMQFTAIGDNVNIASRLESQTKEFGCGILASADTIAASSGLALTGRSQSVHLKGRQQPVEVFEILSLKTESS